MKKPLPGALIHPFMATHTIFLSVLGLLHPQAPRSRKRTWDQDEDACEVGGQAFDHRLDLMKKREPFNPDYLKLG